MQDQLKDQKDARMTSMVDDAKNEIEALMRVEDIFTDALERDCPDSEDGKHSLHPVDGFCVLCHAGMLRETRDDNQTETARRLIGVSGRMERMGSHRKRLGLWVGRPTTMGDRHLPRMSNRGRKQAVGGGVDN